VGDSPTLLLLEKPMVRSTAKPRYDVHPGVAMMRKWADELPAKTGRTLDQWAKFINNSGIEGRQDRIAFLKDEHGIGTNSAWYIVDYAADKHSWDGDPDVYLAQAEKYVEEQYAGPKAAFAPSSTRSWPRSASSVATSESVRARRSSPSIAIASLQN
jgi:hypothetical protein